MRDRGIDDIRPVVGKQVFAALAVELVIADSIAGTKNRLVIQPIGEADTRRKVQHRRVDHCAVGDGTRLGLNQRLRSGIEVGQMIPIHILRRHQLVAHSGVDGESAPEFKIVLHVEEVHPLVVVDDAEVVQLVALPSAKNKVRQRRGLFGTHVAAGVGARIIDQRSRTEIAAVIVLAIGWVEVFNFGIDGLILIANLDAVSAFDDRVVDLGIDDEGVLELRVARLRSKLAEVAHVLVVE